MLKSGHICWFIGWFLGPTVLSIVTNWYQNQVSHQEPSRFVRIQHILARMASTASTAQYDVEKFNGQNDFGLWKMKMRALLGNLGLDKALKAEKKLPKTLSEE